MVALVGVAEDVSIDRVDGLLEFGLARAGRDAVRGPLGWLERNGLDSGGQARQGGRRSGPAHEVEDRHSGDDPELAI